MVKTKCSRIVYKYKPSGGEHTLLKKGKPVLTWFIFHLKDEECFMKHSHRDPEMKWISNASIVTMHVGGGR